VKDMEGRERAEDVEVVEVVNGPEAMHEHKSFEPPEDEARHGVDGPRIGCWRRPVDVQGHCESVHLVFALGLKALGDGISACMPFIEGDR
jgi:hypothetical protein